MDKLIKNLDLDEFLQNFKSFFAREKEFFIQGDSFLHLARIKEFCEFDLKAPKPVKELKIALIHLSKKGVLHLEEIEEFVKILNYFRYLKSLSFTPKIAEYLEKITYPDEINSLLGYFKDDKFDESKDERLLELARKEKELAQAQGNIFRKIISQNSIKDYLIDSQVHFINNTECLLLRGGFSKVLPANIVARSSGGGFYAEPVEAAKIRAQIKNCANLKDEILYEFSKKFSEILGRHLLFLKFIDKEFDLIDCYLARAFFAKANDLEFINPSKDQSIKLVEFSHPAIKNAKPVSVDFSKKVLLITGVNAGGKSMLLKSILSASFLCKYLIPMRINANKSKIGIFKDYKTIIEDPQSSKNDISTFAGRMMAFARLRGAKNYLLGVDEIELGTDFEEASLLFFTLINDIKKNAKMIITTHHKRLALMLAKDDDVELLAALYDAKNEKPKYEFLNGVVGKSYAFETAKRYGISPALIENAKKMQSEVEQNMSDLLNKNLELDAKLKMQIASYEKKEHLLDTKLENIANEQERLEKEAKIRLNALEKEYFEAIKLAKECLKNKDEKQIHRLLNAAHAKKSKIHTPQEKKPNKADFKVGCTVKYGAIKGKIIALNKDTATIQSDTLQLKINIKELKLTQEVKDKSSGVTYEKNPQKASVKLDLHGFRAEEAIDALDEFISNALLAGFDEVLVYHGIGTGRLAFVVKEFLKNHKSVKDFCDAPANAGGFGAKIIKL